jgi:hypothetical protein
MEYELTLTASMEFLGIGIPNHNEFDRQLVLKFQVRSFADASEVGVLGVFRG